MPIRLVLSNLDKTSLICGASSVHSVLKLSSSGEVRVCVLLLAFTAFVVFFFLREKSLTIFLAIFYFNLLILTLVRSARNLTLPFRVV